MFPRIWKCGTAFGVVIGFDQQLFPCVPLRCALPGRARAAAAERETDQIGFTSRSTLAVRRGRRSGSFSMTAPAPNASTESFLCTLFPARIPKPDPKAGQVWTKSTFLLNRERLVFFRQDRKKMGGCIPRLPVRETCLTPRQRSHAPSAGHRPRRT